MSGLIHVGAWDGREYAGYEGPLILFEPQRIPFLRLEESFGERPQTILRSVALGAKPGTADMYVTEPSHSSSLLHPEELSEVYPHISLNGHVTVEVSTLDREMAGLKGFDQMVLDVQGYELEVLKGGTETLKGLGQIKCEVATVELYRGQPMLEDIDLYLGDWGFARIGMSLVSGHGDAIYERA